MDAEKPERSWWQRKRFRFPVLLAMAYPFGLWPVSYFMGLGVLSTPSRFAAVAYAPLWPVVYTADGVRPGFEWFVDGTGYFYVLGLRHAAED